MEDNLTDLVLNVGDDHTFKIVYRDRLYNVTEENYKEALPEVELPDGNNEGKVYHVGYTGEVTEVNGSDLNIQMRALVAYSDNIGEHFVESSETSVELTTEEIQEKLKEMSNAAILKHNLFSFDGVSEQGQIEVYPMRPPTGIMYECEIETEGGKELKVIMGALVDAGMGYAGEGVLDL